MANEQVIDYRAIWSAFGSVSITKSDSTVLPNPCRALYIGGPTVATLGTVVVRMLDGTQPSFSVIPGTTLYIQFDMVLSTGTTATLMVGLF